MELISAKNYIKIYVWRVLSIATGFLSLIIVVPHLSEQQELYGIYAFCISFSFYLSYADIGFLSAGRKFATEEYAKNNTAGELGITGFSLSLLALFFLPFSLFMLCLSTDPAIVFSELGDDNKDIAGKLFLIIGLLLPIQIFLQRMVEFVLLMRLKDYISLKVDIVFNLVKVFSVYYFFSSSGYFLVEYYLFITLLSILGSIVSIFIIRKTIKYEFYLLFKSLRIKPEYYAKCKHLAFSSFASTIGFVIYYELDLIIAGKWFGASDVAIYAIGFVFLNFLRNLWNILYSPFSQRLNHFSGQGRTNKIGEMLSKIMEYTLPLYVVLTSVLVLGADHLVMYWVGNDYMSSVFILQVLVLSTAFGVITQPASYYYSTCLKYKYLYLLSVVLPAVFLFSIFMLADGLGVDSIAVAKFIVSVVAFLVGFKAVSNILQPIMALKRLLFPAIVFCVVFVSVFPGLVEEFFIAPQKNVIGLIEYLLFLSVIVIVGYVTIVISRKASRSQIIALVNEYNGRR